MLKSKRRLLVEYMQDKSKYFAEKTCIDLYDIRDYVWVKFLPTKDVNFILQYMHTSVSQKDAEKISDSLICPQCVLFRYVCKLCYYGLNNGICMNSLSAYQKIKRNVSSANLVTSIDDNNSILKLLFKWNKIK